MPSSTWQGLLCHHQLQGAGTFETTRLLGQALPKHCQPRSANIKHCSSTICCAVAMLENNAGTGQNKFGLNWGNGFITDRAVINKRGLSDPNAFFSALVKKPYHHKVRRAYP
jgi:hypothetical protein